MHIDHQLGRRAFLKRAGQLAFAGAAAPLAMNLAAMGEAAAFSAGDGSYKALVCVFLYGGNDNGNTLIPVHDDGYADYSRLRGGLPAAGGVAFSQAQLAPTTLAPIVDGRQFALSPHLTQLKTLFDAGKLAVQHNIGPLIVPVTKAEYNARPRTIALPPQLFSHEDQQFEWQTTASAGAARGWGGKMGDLALGAGSNSGATQGSMFTCMSVTGNAVFLAADQALRYQIGSGGPTKIKSVADPTYYGSAKYRDTMFELLTGTRANALENAHNVIRARAITAEQALSGQLTGDAKEYGSFPNSGLANQLKMVARLIVAGKNLGLKRQVFMVSIGGFDNHSDLLSNHARTLPQLDGALAAFQAALESKALGSEVTTFTMSDFGRTVAFNGTGSDHGWGSVHFVMGGAVKGGALYGTAPDYSEGSTDDLGRGRYIPTTALDQYVATLGKWFGVDDGEMSIVAPNIANFTPNLGFI